MLKEQVLEFALLIFKITLSFIFFGQKAEPEEIKGEKKKKGVVTKDTKKIVPIQ